MPIQSGGHAVVRKAATDYQPPADESVVLWLDSSGGSSSSAITTTRGSQEQRSSSGAVLQPRRGSATSFVAPAGEVGVGRQAAQSVLAFGATRPSAGTGIPLPTPTLPRFGHGWVLWTTWEHVDPDSVSAR